MAAATDMQAEYDVQNPAALRRLLGAGAQLRTFLQNLLQEAYRASIKVYRDLSEKNPHFKKLYEHQLAFRNQSYQWWKIADYSFNSLMIQAIWQQWQDPCTAAAGHRRPPAPANVRFASDEGNAASRALRRSACTDA